METVKGTVGQRRETWENGPPMTSAAGRLNYQKKSFKALAALKSFKRLAAFSQDTCHFSSSQSWLCGPLVGFTK